VENCAIWIVGKISITITLVLLSKTQIPPIKPRCSLMPFTIGCNEQQVLFFKPRKEFPALICAVALEKNVKTALTKRRHRAEARQLLTEITSNGSPRNHLQAW